MTSLTLCIPDCLFFDPKQEVSIKGKLHILDRAAIFCYTTHAAWGPITMAQLHEKELVTCADFVMEGSVVIFSVTQAQFNKPAHDYITKLLDKEFGSQIILPNGSQMQ